MYCDGMERISECVRLQKRAVCGPCKTIRVVTLKLGSTLDFFYSQYISRVEPAENTSPIKEVPNSRAIKRELEN